jgi:hypothetical protein
MGAIFSFKCSCCGEIHEGSPSFGFRAPNSYLDQTEEVQNAGSLGTDLCNYEDEDGVHHFIRVCLEVPIHGVDDPFTWGVWVSLSEKSFSRYVDTYDNPDTSDRYFGWLCNHLPYYENTYALKAHVHPRKGGTRPFIVLEKTTHTLSVDFHEGISISRAQEIAEAAMHR